MKRLLLIPILLFAGFSFGQIVDQFTYSGSANANGWLTQSGIGGQISTLTSASDNGNSLSFTGLQASAGNRTTLVAGNTEDINKGVTGITGTGYYSFLLKVSNTTGLTTAAAGDYFIGFGNVNTTGLTVYAGRVYIKTGSVAGTFQLGVLNTTGGTTTTTFTGDYPVGTTLFVVVKLNTTTSPYTAALFVNPVPGATEPTPTITNTSGTSTTSFTTFGSIALRQAGNATAGTGNLEIDEIRAGSDWASVTPSGVVNCNTTSTITASECTSYTAPSGAVYNTTGTYMDTIPNAAMCDSVITINLTITGPTTSSITTSSCTSYTAPSGAVYTSSGIYTDTIANHLGCDSIITIDLTIVTSITFYADTDTDGLGDPNNTTTNCTQPGGFVTNSNDCDDNNASIGAATTWYLDNDLDGYGSSTSTTNCTQPVGYVSNSTDCDDNDANIHPGATEIANNGIDEDCAGGDLVIAPATLGQYQFTGNDCSGANIAVTAQPANATFSDYEVVGGQTCNAANNVINYNGWNMTGVIDPTQYYGFTLTPASCYGLNLTTLKFSHRVSSGAPTVTVRSSLDNFTADLYTGTVPTGTTTPVTVTLPAAYSTVYGAIEFRFYITTMGTTGATYRHDDVSLLGFINALPTQTFYADADGDGFGDAATSATNCVPPVGYVTDNTDCNDNNAAEHPGAMWAIDSDGDGFIGSATQTSCTQPTNYISVSSPVDCDDNDNTVHGQNIYYADVDMDGFGNLNDTTMDCTQPVGYVTNSTDCDDNDNTVGAASVQYYLDADNDTYGDPNNFIYACSATAGYVANFDDCNDSNPAVHPGATEVCDGIDNDCDNSIDEGVPTFTFYADTDNDGLGDPNSSVTDCSTPAGYVGNHNDCDDTDPTPGAGATVFYMDSDSDGYGDETNSISTCTAPTGYVAAGGDCNDANDAIHPGATDNEGNGIDENCDGVDGNLGISEMSISNLVAYPNPGTASVTVTFSGSMENTAVRFLGVDGKAVNTGKTEVSASGIVVSTLNLVPGVYFIEVTQGNATKTVRWVKQ